MKQFITLSLVIAVFFGMSVAYDNIEISQELFNGFWQEANLSVPTGLAEKCFTADDAQLFVTTVNVTLSLLSEDKVYNAIAMLNYFNKQLPYSAKECLRVNPKTQQVYDAYNISNLTLPQFETKIGQFLISHFTQVESQIQSTQYAFHAGNFTQTGINAGIFLKQAL